MTCLGVERRGGKGEGTSVRDGRRHYALWRFGGDQEGVVSGIRVGAAPDCTHMYTTRTGGPQSTPAMLAGAGDTRTSKSRSQFSDAVSSLNAGWSWKAMSSCLRVRYGVVGLATGAGDEGGVPGEREMNSVNNCGPSVSVLFFGWTVVVVLT